MLGIKYVSRLLGRGRETGETAGPYHTTETRQSNRKPNPRVEFYGKLYPDLSNFAFITLGMEDELRAARFEEGDYVFLRFSQNGNSAAMPGRVLKNHRPDRDNLEVYTIPADLTREFSRANMQGSDEVVRLKVSLRYRLQPHQDQATILQRASTAYPKDMRRHFDGIQLRMPITEQIERERLYRRLIDVLNRRIEALSSEKQ